MRIVIIIFILITNTTIFAQINVGSNEQVRLHTGDFEQADLDKLKSSTTLFIYREGDNDNLERFKSTLKKAWDYTDIEFISYKEFSTNRYDDNYSFFSIGGIHKVSSAGVHTKIYLTLWMNKGDEKLTFCRIELYPTYQTFEKATNYIERDVDLMMKYLYTKSTLHNWNLLYLKNALQFVDRKLTNSEDHWLFESEVYTDLSPLKNDTLYIPEYTLIKFSPVSGDESQRHDVEKLLKKYPYPYKILSTEELTEKKLNSGKPWYYLSYIKSSTDKYVSVVNGQTGELLYSDYSSTSYNIKSKDLGKLAKKIK